MAADGHPEVVEGVGGLRVIEPSPLHLDLAQEPKRDPTGGLLDRLLQEVTDGHVVAHGRWRSVRFLA
jgi:hypothetical protein